MSMKKNRLLVIFVLALASGGLAGFLALRELGDRVPAMVLEPRSSRTRLAVAARDLPVGSLVRNEDIRLIDWPDAATPVGYSASVEELVGRGLITPMRTNEPFLSSKLADRDSGGGLPILIDDGMRAVSVRVDEVISVAGYVVPGTRVDVLVTVAPGGDNQNAVTRVVLQNVRVLSAGQTLERDQEGKPQTVSVVTLLVTPEDGEKLVLAANEGRVQLALRNMLDVAEASTPGARLTTLVAAPSSPARTARAVRVDASGAPANRATVVETIRGGQRTLNTFSGNR